MNIYLRELKANLKSLLVWTGIIALLLLIAVAKYSAYADNPEMLKLLDSMPQGLLDALNMETFNLTTLTGFFGVLFVYFALMGAIAAAMWGSDILSKEERDKTVEFLLTLPVSRARALTAKALAALTNAALFMLFTWGLSLATVQRYAPDRAFKDFLRLEMSAMLMLELLFLALGLLLGASMKRYKRAGSTAVATIIGTYFLSVAIGMYDKLDFLKWFTPFSYFDAGALYRAGRMDTTYVTLSFFLTALMLAAAYWRYARRDLYV